jgi:hypothetical protein
MLVLSAANAKIRYNDFIQILCIENNRLQVEVGTLHPVLEESCVLDWVRRGPGIGRVQLITFDYAICTSYEYASYSGPRNIEGITRLFH